MDYRKLYDTAKSQFEIDMCLILDPVLIDLLNNISTTDLTNKVYVEYFSCSAPDYINSVTSDGRTIVYNSFGEKAFVTGDDEDDSLDIFNFPATVKIELINELTSTIEKSKKL
jgi:hypothetical protein